MYAASTWLMKISNTNRTPKYTCYYNFHNSIAVKPFKAPRPVV